MSNVKIFRKHQIQSIKMSDNNKTEYFCLKMIMKFAPMLSEVHHVPLVLSYRLDGRQRFFGTNKAKAKFIETYLTSRSWKEAFRLDQDDLNQAENYSYFKYHLHISVILSPFLGNLI